MVKKQETQDDPVDSVYDEIEAIYRRALARSRRINAPLTQVEHSLLSFIGAHPGCRATDIASAFSLNRSTVSRQLHALADLSLVTAGEEEQGQGRRGRMLYVTDEGLRRLETSLSVQRSAVKSRLRGWSQAELQDFLAALKRFNEEPGNS
ncbi:MULTISPECIES: MarR family winged helix-turn-helix transcriptional regulator [unclassified Arthrobacter]|uniref:MarR family winged helix-turn-helix transcriptional regulator n=1 Tax=unclassified Arthrobacter TaxID=235627 RepID=UPI001D14C696|nr:MarR family winged helix-turn-helix transcriptional regulator [Arthrobacter sp. zg-Y1143]MCC3277689.1 MarR family winged helix-turn-helix transcriptional regulator [Arthrobacter sp. zg-Y40]MCC9176094.1 MarR family winged helix-turn-helix transcriptional regulator [Arthrobacter sp. zg-Y750]